MHIVVITILGALHPYDKEAFIMIKTLPFKPGFRISGTDSAVLATGIITSAFAAQTDGAMSLVVLFTVSHFFLFCNVFRIARLLEIAWAVLFVAMAACTITLQRPAWVVTFSASLLATLVVIAVEMRKPSYHGIAWQRINPQLPEWWEAQSTKSG